MRSFGLIGIVLGFSAWASLAIGQDRGQDQRLAPEDFAILAWGGAPADKAVLADIRDCGFNLAGFVAVDGLDAVAEAGLKCFVSDPSVHVSDSVADLPDKEVLDRVQVLTARVNNHPAAFGYYLRDEPSARMWPALARQVMAIRASAPQAKSYINLFPNYASAAQLGTDTYEEHVESFITKVRPPFVSYDHYALMDDGSLRGGYFQNLETIRAAALRHKLPFWNIVLSNAHFSYAEPSPGGLRFQMYTTLAYGGRGISYFTYFTSATGNYRLGPINQFGDKTATWYMLREVNLQIHRLGPTYLKLKSVNVFHHPDVPAGCSGLDTSRFVKAISGGQFVVGEFEGSDSVPYVMIVNKDLHRSTAFQVAFKLPGTVLQTNSYTGQTHPWAGENIWLAPGQGMLLSVKKE